MSGHSESPRPNKTTANESISEIDPGGTRPAPSKGQPKSRPEVHTGDQNTDTTHSTDD